eukprot:CAMPEP_0167779824 /NCGR_PEP_ID=MMETSP0111_2-20121227/5017_1 /TAXON_ID=91324 /ORGANISM="Lotharella globosa, Strain CCCM811" /LENGTH=107 /DNA_ID=CAMNT_0007670269 /DNA_START=39 /DNA_END=358 /DNA_ORIENTATION=+
MNQTLSRIEILDSRASALSSYPVTTMVGITLGSSLVTVELEEEGYVFVVSYACDNFTRTKIDKNASSGSRSSDSIFHMTDVKVKTAIMTNLRNRPNPHGNEPLASDS